MPGIFQRFSETAARFPDLIALQIKDEGSLRSFTFREVYERACSIGAYLTDAGTGKGDRVAIFSENCPEWGMAYLGIVSTGAVAVPLDAQYTKDEVKNLLKDSESRAIFTSRELLPAAEKASEGLNIKIIRLDEPLPENPPLSSSSRDVARNVSTDDLASLLYTSGTTGVPKGVMLTNGNLLSNADAIIESGIVAHDDHVLGILPLHHSYPFMVCFLVPIIAGGRVTYLNSLKGPDIVKTIREEGITIVVGVPQLFALMRKGILGKIYSLSGLAGFITRGLFVVSRGVRKGAGINIGKVVFKKVHREFGNTFRFFASGGARLDPAVLNDMEGLGFTIFEGYGLTETSPVATFNLPGRKKTGSVGRAIDQVEVKIENPDASGVGEIIIRGPNVMKGYYKRPDLTAEVIKSGSGFTPGRTRGTGASEERSDARAPDETVGWFHSGDLGYLDKEGFLFITGRSKEVIVLGSGKNIYPEDVESHYLQSPYIKEICVIGIPDTDHPGSFGGIKALIFPNLEKLSADGIANISEQIRWQIEKFSASLPSYKRISGFSILKEPLPRTHLGKIRRFMVRETELAGIQEEPPISDEDQRLMESDTAKVVLHALASITDKRISVNSNLELDLGIDSLGRVEIMAALETGLGVLIPQSFASEVTTVKDVILKTAEYTVGASGIEALKRPVSWGDILQKSPSEDMIERIGLKRGLISNASVRAAAWLFYLLTRLFLRLEIRGIENVPPEGGCIIAPNHASYIDGFLMAGVLRNRLPMLFAVGFRGLFQGRLMSRAARWGHIMRIDADSGLSESLQVSSYILREGAALCIFPEGGRSVDGRILPFKKGVGILARELNVAMIPTFIEGTLDVLPRGAWIPRLKKVTVTFGRPLTTEDIQGLDYQQIADRLRERVAALSVPFSR